MRAHGSRELDHGGAAGMALVVGPGDEQVSGPVPGPPDQFPAHQLMAVAGARVGAGVDQARRPVVTAVAAVTEYDVPPAADGCRVGAGRPVVGDVQVTLTRGHGPRPHSAALW